MKQRLTVIVEVSTSDPSHPFKKVYDKLIEIDDSICVPYTNLLSSLKFLYGSDSIITFSIW